MTLVSRRLTGGDDAEMTTPPIRPTSAPPKARPRPGKSAVNTAQQGPAQPGADVAAAHHGDAVRLDDPHLGEVAGRVRPVPADLLPEEWDWEQLLATPWRRLRSLTYFRNSLIISVGHTAITLLFGSMAGYALARLPFRGRELIFLGFVAMLMIPTYTKIVPQFLIVKFMPLFGGNDILGQGGSGWLDTWWALHHPRRPEHLRDLPVPPVLPVASQGARRGSPAGRTAASSASTPGSTRR